MEINDLTKLVLIASLSFSIVGISIQIMRLLGSLNETIKMSHEIIRSFGKISSKISEDYETFSKHLLTLSGAISHIGTDVIVPFVGLFSFLDRFRGNKD